MSILKEVRGQCCEKSEENGLLLAVEIRKGFMEEMVSELDPKDGWGLEALGWVGRDNTCTQRVWRAPWTPVCRFDPDVAERSCTRD